MTGLRPGAWGVGLAAALLVSAAPDAQAPEAGAVRDKLDAYLLTYEPQLSALVADEEMTQRARESWVVTYRKLRSEVAFIALPGSAGWLGFRRVLSVNDKPIKDQGVPLAQLMLEGASDDYDQAHLLLEESAAHNLGAARTINLPNLPLELLHPRHRHRFSHRVDGTERIRRVRTVRLVAEERSLPTIIQQQGAGDMRSTITAWVEADTGRLHRAEVRSHDARLGRQFFDAVVWVDFKDHPAMGLLVPVEMKEEFFVSRAGWGTGTAKYTNYRRFQTAVRLVPPPGR